MDITGSPLGTIPARKNSSQHQPPHLDPSPSLPFKMEKGKRFFRRRTIALKKEEKRDGCESVPFGTPELMTEIRRKMAAAEFASLSPSEWLNRHSDVLKMDGTVEEMLLDALSLGNITVNRRGRLKETVDPPPPYKRTPRLDHLSFVTRGAPFNPLELDSKYPDTFGSICSLEMCKRRLDAIVARGGIAQTVSRTFRVKKINSDLYTVEEITVSNPT